MNRNLLKIAPLAVVLAVAAGCATKSTELDEAKAMATAAQQSANEAKQAAADAQNTANQALQTANEAKQESAQANEKIDRAFKQTMKK